MAILRFLPGTSAYTLYNKTGNAGVMRAGLDLNNTYKGRLDNDNKNNLYSGDW